MSTTDTKVDELIINTLTKAQYDDLVANNQVEANQLYLTKDEDYYMQIAITYGTTTYAQITSALGAKQEPVCNYNSYQYTYAGNDGTYYYFTCAINNEIKYIRVNSASTWSNGTASLQTTISDLGTIRANASLGASAVQPSDLATVATTGSYTDLTATPSLSTVATSGSYNDLINKPAIPQGTVTSVRVQAGTGLSSSQSTAQSSTLNTTISIASGYKLPTTTEWSNKQDALPSQSGNSGKFLTTNGSTMSWATVQGGGDSLPDQTGQDGKFLTTNGSTATWADVQDSLDLEEMTLEEVIPNQSGNSGKYLTTNGTTTSWATVSAGDSLPSQSGNDGKFLTTNGSTASWANVEDSLDLEELDINNLMPSQSGNSGKFLSTNGSSVYWASTGGGGSGYVPMPTVSTLTNTTYTLSITENTIYKFSNAVTSLTISSAEVSDLESLVYFTTGSSITFVDNSTLKWGGGSIPSLAINTTYCIAIKNGLAELDKFGR